MNASIKDMALRPARQPGVTSGLSYLKPNTDRPHSYAYQPPPGTPWEHGEYELHQTAISDARHAVEPAHIDREGFTLRDAPSTVKNFFDVDEVKHTYYQEAAELAKLVTGASQAHVFDHMVRRREPDRATLTFGRRGADGLPAANGRIHNDYTEASGRQRLTMVLSDQAAHLGTRRYSIVNVWRAINGPVTDTPLAVCDARSVMAADLVACDVHYPRRTGEIYTALHSPLHHWFYYSAMDRHEALVFKQYDAQLSGKARFVLHAAFDLPEIPPGAPRRESIELRCLLVHDSEA